MKAEISVKRVALGLEYLGTRYHGWQKQDQQKGIATVQRAVMDAYYAICHECVRLSVGGRTDAGVHALGQVVHFDTQKKLNAQQWKEAFNHYLPQDISITWAKEVSPEFHARYSARAREYVYWINTSGRKRGIWQNHMLYCPRPLSTQAITDAMEVLCGEKDFTSFRAKDCQSKSSQRFLFKSTLDVFDNHHLKFCFKANAFLHHMVRNLVGSLLWVGQGIRDVQWFYQLFAVKNRSLAGPTAPPHGLYLTQIDYPTHYGLDQNLDSKFFDEFCKK